MVGSWIVRGCSPGAVAKLALAVVESGPAARRVPDKRVYAVQETARLAHSALTVPRRAVLYLLGKGYSAKDIARRLNLSASTVSYHLTEACTWLGVNTRAQAVAVAMRRGLL